MKKRHGFLLALAIVAAAGAACRTDRGPAPTPRWIGPDRDQQTADKAPLPILRRSFRVAGRPRSGKVRLVGLGHYRLTLNGRRVGDSAIDQALSQYDKTLYVQEFDITALLRPGENVFGLMLGNSFWRVAPSEDPARFKGFATDFAQGRTHLLWLEAEIETRRGRTTVVSDSGWTWRNGPVAFSDVYGGEDFDARLEPPGWDEPGAAADGWRPAAVLPAPKAELIPLIGPPMTEHEVFPPAAVRDLGQAGYVYDFPQNCSALLRFTVSGEAGQRIRFKPAEDIDEAGRVRFPYTWDTGQEVWQDYILRGGGDEPHQTLFFYVGCRHVGVTGAVPAGKPNPSRLPVIRKLELVHVRAANRTVGAFECSSALQNGIQRISDWAVRSNMGFYATDCPHREKYAWLEQTWHMARSLSYLFDVREWDKRQLRAMRDVQRPEGHILTKAPMYLTKANPHGKYHEAAEWGVAGVLVPWHVYEWYGDRGALAASYESMKRYIDYLQSQARDGIITSNLGDWLDYGHGREDGPSQWTPPAVAATAVWARGAQTVAKAARALGREDDAARFKAMSGRIKADFQRHFYDPATKTVRNGGSCQAANAAALGIGLIPEADRAGALQAIVDDLRRRGWQQTVGEVFHVFFMRALAEGGRQDVLEKVYGRDGVGSFGHMVKNGLTTLPETWDARRGTIYGLNHFALGHLVEWHFAYVAGIRQEDGGIGWRKVLIAPQPGSLRSAAATFDGPTGRISARWRIEGREFRLTAEVPEGVQATAVLPDGSKLGLKPGINELELK